MCGRYGSLALCGVQGWALDREDTVTADCIVAICCPMATGGCRTCRHDYGLYADRLSSFRVSLPAYVFSISRFPSESISAMTAVRWHADTQIIKLS